MIVLTNVHKPFMILDAIDCENLPNVVDRRYGEKGSCYWWGWLHWFASC